MKKWFMLQVWRLQQVAQILTLALLALNLSLQIFGLIKWRENSVLSISYVGVPLIILLLAMVIWTFAIFWDLRLKMWRDQATVLIERNPYSKERMSSKEVALYLLLWLPLLDKVGSDDRNLKISAQAMREWMERELKMDPVLKKDVNDLFTLFLRNPEDAFELLKRRT